MCVCMEPAGGICGADCQYVCMYMCARMCVWGVLVAGVYVCVCVMLMVIVWRADGRCVCVELTASLCGADRLTVMQSISTCWFERFIQTPHVITEVSQAATCSDLTALVRSE